MVLLHFLRWVRERACFDFDVLFRKGGELEPECAALANRSYRWPETYEDLAAPEAQSLDELLERLGGNHYQLIYANSIICSHMLPSLWNALRVPVIVHVHELEGLIQLTCGDGILDQVVSRVSRFIAVSDLVRDNLVERHDIPPDRIARIPEFVEAALPITRQPVAIRETLGVPPDAVLVGACGKVGWRKGTDLFIAVAERVSRLSRRPIHFVWLGDHGSRADLVQLQQDVQKLNLDGRVHFPGSTSEPQNYFNAFDLFLMTSREDPFPLVCLESGRAGNPIICFDKAVGCREYVDASCGHLSPYLDVDDMAAAVVEFADDERRESASRVIRERVSDYTVENYAPKIADTITQVVDRGPSGDGNGVSHRVASPRNEPARTRPRGGKTGERRCFIMIGPLGAGKTTFAKRFCEERGLVYLSPDDHWDRSKLREYSNEISINAWGNVYAQIYECIKREQEFLVDTAQRERRSRREITGIIRSMSHGEYKITGIHVKRDLGQCLESVRGREEIVPDERVREYYDSLQQQPPDPGDGYDEIIEVDGGGDTESI